MKICWNWVIASPRRSECYDWGRWRRIVDWMAWCVPHWRRRRCAGLQNDVYFQIGLLVLIGLGAKNAVLRVSAAVDFRRQGYSIMDATRLAGEQRLRPIIMTSLAFAVGVLPLASLGGGWPSVKTCDQLRPCPWRSA